MIYSSSDSQYFGYLPQLATFYGLACTPTSSTNALTYVVTRPDFLGETYAPLTTYSGWESVRDDLATNYYYTSPNVVPAGTLPARALIGMNQYLDDNGLQQHISLSAVGISTDPQGNNIAGWNTPAQNGLPAIGPASQYSQWFTEQRVTGDFLRASLLQSDAVLVGGFYDTVTGDPAGHAILITELDWTDSNNNGIIDEQDNATVKILDPLNPSETYSPRPSVKTAHGTYSPALSDANYIGYGAGSTVSEQLDNALNSQVTATGGPSFSTGSIMQNELGALVVTYDQYSLNNVDGYFVSEPGDVSNGSVQATDMTLMFAMTLGSNGLPNGVEQLIEKDAPAGTFVFDYDIFGNHKIDGIIYTNEESLYENTLHFYPIVDPRGIINDADGDALLPGDQGYAELALSLALGLDQSSLLTMDQPRVSQDVEQLQAFELNLPEASLDSNELRLAPIVTTSYKGEVLYHWFAYSAANFDLLPHIKELAPGTYGVEDLPMGGDLDFNDLVFQLVPVGMSEVSLII